MLLVDQVPAFYNAQTICFEQTSTLKLQNPYIGNVLND